MTTLETSHSKAGLVCFFPFSCFVIVFADDAVVCVAVIPATIRSPPPLGSTVIDLVLKITIVCSFLYCCDSECRSGSWENRGGGVELVEVLVEVLTLVGADTARVADRAAMAA